MNLLTYYKSKIANLSEFQDFGFFEVMIKSGCNLSFDWLVG